MDREALVQKLVQALVDDPDVQEYTGERAAAVVGAPINDVPEDDPRYEHYYEAVTAELSSLVFDIGLHLRNTK